MIMHRLSRYSKQKNIEVEEFLSDYSYDQAVMTKTKKSKVKIIQFDTFFSVLRSLNIYDGKHVDNVTEILCIDQNYWQSLMVKKISKLCQTLPKYEYYSGY